MFPNKAGPLREDSTLYSTSDSAVRVGYANLDADSAALSGDRGRYELDNAGHRPPLRANQQRDGIIDRHMVLHMYRRRKNDQQRIELNYFDDRGIRDRDEFSFVFVDVGNNTVDWR